MSNSLPQSSSVTFVKFAIGSRKSQLLPLSLIGAHSIQFISRSSDHKLLKGNGKGKAKGDTKEGHPQGGQAVDVTCVEIHIRSSAISHLMFGILVRYRFVALM
ncbi:uncharacterized protein LOC114076043 [Solanum pennellii]|uniref:Uncharacterized protein LOC114076043 n=1 Tax=Solanum pennellii TaxID=28526 RepID=A0ABM1V307_SOLPN|nr:uncharacterized protein LOC114076043 [Solanum pennellii]